MERHQTIIKPEPFFKRGRPRDEDDFRWFLTKSKHTLEGLSHSCRLEERGSSGGSADAKSHGYSRDRTGFQEKNKNRGQLAV